MPVTITPETTPPLQQTEHHHDDGWLRRIIRHIRLALSDDDYLWIDNQTPVSWRIYQDYHLLGIIDGQDRQRFHLIKRGSLNVCPITEAEREYLIQPLTQRIRRVRIYRRQFAKTLEVYDLAVT